MRRGRHGQASVELLGALPVLVLAVVFAWQLVVLLAAAGEAGDRARAGALAAPGAPGAVVTTTATVRAPLLLPGAGSVPVPARAAVRLP